MKQKIQCTVLTLVTAALLCSCASTSGLTREGVPHSKYLVGGGPHIEYVAPADGTAFVFEETTGRMLVTKSLEAGAFFRLNAGAGSMFVSSSGIKASEAILKFYFVPDPEESP